MGTTKETFAAKDADAECSSASIRSADAAYGRHLRLLHSSALDEAVPRDLVGLAEGIAVRLARGPAGRQTGKAA